MKLISFFFCFLLRCCLRLDANAKQVSFQEKKQNLQKLHFPDFLLLQSDCKDIARSQAEKDRQRRRREDPLAPLVGFAKHEVDRGRLENCSLAKLQVGIMVLGLGIW